MPLRAFLGLGGTMTEESPFHVEKRDGKYFIVGEFASGEMILPMWLSSRAEANRISKALREAYERGKEAAVIRIARGLEVRRRDIESLSA
jgi:hypothetical protein